MTNISLHTLVLRIIKSYKDKYNELLKPLNYYLSWYSEMIVMETDKGRILFNYKKYLKEDEILSND